METLITIIIIGIFVGAIAAVVYFMKKQRAAQAEPEAEPIRTAATPGTEEAEIIREETRTETRRATGRTRPTPTREERQENENGFNWTKISLWGVAILILIAIVLFAVFSDRKEPEPTVVTDSPVVAAAKALLAKNLDNDVAIGIYEENLATKTVRGKMTKLTKNTVLRNHSGTPVMITGADGKTYPYILKSREDVRVLSLIPVELDLGEGRKSQPMLQVTSEDPYGQFSDGFIGYVPYSHTDLYSQMANDPINFHAGPPQSYVPQMGASDAQTVTIETVIDLSALKEKSASIAGPDLSGRWQACIGPDTSPACSDGKFNGSKFISPEMNFDLSQASLFDWVIKNNLAVGTFNGVQLKIVKLI